MKETTLMKVPDEALIDDLKKTIRHLEFKIGQDEAYIQELQFTVKGLMELTKEERIVLKNDHLIRTLNKQNKILGGIISDYRSDMAKLIHKLYEKEKVQKDNTE